MFRESGNYYCLLLLVLMGITFAGLYAAEPSTTGYSIRDISDFSEFAVEVFDNERQVCADGSFFQECSTLIKGKFCHLGKLTDYCELCGCEAGEVCSNRKCVKVE